MRIQLFLLFLCCVVLLIAKVVIYHCMNIVFSKVARFARIVQLNPRLILPLELLSASLQSLFGHPNMKNRAPEELIPLYFSISVLFVLYDEL